MNELNWLVVVRTKASKFEPEYKNVVAAFNSLVLAEDSKCFSINPKTLKAIKVSPEEWEKLEKAGNWGIGNLKQAEKSLKSKRRGYVSDKKRAAANITIDIFRKICE